jgi:hypothetical protein
MAVEGGPFYLGTSLKVLVCGRKSPFLLAVKARKIARKICKKIAQPLLVCFLIYGIG